MRVLFDIVHPAHVHFFKNMIRGLSARGHQTQIVARDKDVTNALLDRLGFAYESIGRPRQSLFGMAGELLRRDWALAKAARAFGADLIVTRNPAGAQVGRLLRIRSVFDTDDGKAAGVHFWSAAPFAHVITTPDCSSEDYGARHVKYPGYKQTAYLHPNHFTPDPSVLQALGIAAGERYFIVRFVAMGASHDVGEGGLPLDAKQALLDKLRAHGKVFVSSESVLPEALAPLKFPLPPDRLHDALAFADLLVGDSQTMAAEAAVLGTPSLRVSSWTGRLAYLSELEQRYGLTFAYQPDKAERLLAHVDRWLLEPHLRQSLAPNHQRLMAEKVDVARWFVEFLEAGATLPR
ncbi:MAG TPA: glycosyltransferase [Polyangiaceae bacterium]|nr:glycosyltransferase [Polyangiaceae bacterium]